MKLWVTKQLTQPLEDIRGFLKHKKPLLKYRLYSAHDTNIAAIIKVIDPTYWMYDYVPYASNIYFAVYKKADEHFVNVTYNGKTVDFCSYCTVDQFLKRIEKHLY